MTLHTQNIQTADIEESPLNPRKRFDEDSLRELADSIREQGILQALIVRPQADDQERYELVCGARRLRAARLLELEEVPVVVKDLDDRQTIEMMLVENDQRSGVTPLEEADTILKLSTEHSVSVEEIADRIGRSPTLVRRRLKLASLAQPLRALLDAQRIGLNSAELLATLSEALQSELAEGELAAEKTNYQGEPTTWTHYTVTSVIKRALRKLKRAPWPLSEPIAGCVACSECPRRSSAQPALLAEFAEDDDRCLDAACWKTKKTAFIDQKVAEGWRVLDAEEAKNAADRWSRKKSIQPVTHTVRVDGETRSLESLSPDTPRILALTYAGPVACVEIKDVVADLNERGLKDVAYVISGEKERDAKREKRDEDRKEREKRRAQMAAIVETAQRLRPDKPNPLDDILLETALCELNLDRITEVAKRRELSVEKGDYGRFDYAVAVREHAKSLDAPERYALFVELLLTGSAISPYRHELVGWHDAVELSSVAEP